MEIDESENKRNEVLSQSYIQGVGRVAQQNNDVGFGFELPKEVLRKREKVWDKLFDKYADEVSDEIELNIDTMEPVATADEEDEVEEENEDDQEEEEEQGDEEPEEYYTKCRAPMKKHSSLIQYWIDTGNPPYKLQYEENNSGTGSSLSEIENSDIIQEPNEKPKFEDLSPYSSVDTAAYILSNTNITKKSETLAIVEGSKKSKNSDEIKKIEETKKNLSPIDDKNSSISKENIFDKTLNNSQKNLSITNQRSVKLSEVIPTFKQFDDIFDVSKIINRKSKIIKNNKYSFIKKSSLTKTNNRRKLYTGRDSPVDLESTKDRRRNFYYDNNLPIDLPIDCRDDVKKSINYHPALGPNLMKNDKNLSSRSRARRKKKKLLKIDKYDDNTSQESEKKIDNKNSKGDERYTDFFESLGLTPSKTIIGDDTIKKFNKRTKKHLNDNNRKIKKIKLSNTIESSINEIDTSKFSEISYIDNNNEKSMINDNEKIIENKILRVKIEKLSDNIIAKYCKKNIDDYDNNSKKRRKNFNENIELLNMANQDSDSSTILICACNNDNNDNYSESDNSLITKKLSKNEKSTKSLIKKKNELSIKNDNKDLSMISLKSKNNEKFLSSKSRKLYVSVEKLTIKKSIKNNDLSSNKNSMSQKNLMNFYDESSKKTNEKSLTIDKNLIDDKNNFSSNDKKILEKSNEKSLTIDKNSIDDKNNFSSNDKKILEKSNEKSLTIDKNSIDDKNNFSSNDKKILEKSNNENNLKISISSDDDESFVKIVKNFRSNKKTFDNENSIKSRKNNFEISLQSDDDSSMKIVKKNKSTKYLTKIVNDRNIIDETKDRRKKDENEIEDKIVRRSTRKRKITCDEIFSNFVNRRESNEKSLKIDKIEKSKNEKKIFTKNSQSNGKKSIGNFLNIARFQTRLDSDSDNDFESLRLSINSINEKSINENNKNSLRRSLRNINDSQLKSDENNSNDSKIKKNESIYEKSNNSKDFSEIKKNVSIYEKSNNSNKDSNEMKKNRKKSKIERKNDNSWKSKRLRNLSKISSTNEKQEINEISSNRRKILRNKKIFDTIEYETDDDEKFIKKNSNSIENIGEKLNLLTNDKNDKNNSSKNLFSNFHDDTVDDIDNLFSIDKISRGKQCKVVIDSLNFGNSKKSKNLHLNLRQSTINFRTKLRSDSDDENTS